MPTYTVYPSSGTQGAGALPTNSVWSNPSRITANDSSNAGNLPFLEGDNPDASPTIASDQVQSITSTTLQGTTFDFAGAGLSASETIDSITLVVGALQSGTIDSAFSPIPATRFQSVSITVNGTTSSDLASQNSGNIAGTETAYSFGGAPGSIGLSGITAADLLASASVSVTVKGCRGDTGASYTWSGIIPYVDGQSPSVEIDYVRLEVVTSIGGGAKVFKNEFASPKVFGGMSL